MSITLMTAAFKSHLQSTPKFVLVALCDNANDQGECYPSISMLCEKTSLSERAVQGAINLLVTMKFMKRDIRSGRSTYYFIADPRTWCTPAADAPPQDMHPTPARGAPPPPQHVHPTPAARAPITINEPSIESSRNQKKRGNAAPDEFVPMDYLLANGVDHQVAADWLKHRKLKRADPSQTAIEGQIREAVKAGVSLQHALSTACERGWIGFKAEFVTGQPVRAGPAKPEKFDPSAYVNRNRTKVIDERTIEFNEHGEPV
jgi:hypothetical protein